MTYKNGFKEYFTMGILFGGGMGMVMALSSGDFSSLFLTTVFAGTAFSVLMYLFSRSTEKKFAALRADIERARTVYCDGSANLKSSGGWIILTELGIEFYSHNFNFEKSDTLITFDMITDIKVRSNRLTVHTTSGSPVFVVCQPREWEREIRVHMP